MNFEDANNISYEDNSKDSDFEIFSVSELSEDELKILLHKQKISDEILEKINSSCNLHTSFSDISTFIKIGIEIAGGNPKNYSVSQTEERNFNEVIR